MLGPLLGVRQQVAFERVVLLLGGAPAASAGKRPNGHGAVAQAHKDLGRAADNGETAEIQEK